MKNTFAIPQPTCETSSRSTIANGFWFSTFPSHGHNTIWRLLGNLISSHLISSVVLNARPPTNRDHLCIHNVARERAKPPVPKWKAGGRAGVSEIEWMHCRMSITSFHSPPSFYHHSTPLLMSPYHTHFHLSLD